jgi:hypothetical protein
MNCKISSKRKPYFLQTTLSKLPSPNQQTRDEEKADDYMPFARY